MTEYIDRKEALNFPFANGIYDHDHANEHFISGCKSYREWLSQIPAADVRPVVLCRDCLLRRFCMVAQLLGEDGFCSNGEKREES